MKPTGKFMTVRDGKGGTIDLPIMEGWLSFYPEFRPMGFMTKEQKGRMGSGAGNRNIRSFAWNGKKNEIWNFRKQHGLTQQAMADICGLSNSSIGRYERGEEQAPERVMAVVRKKMSNMEKGQKGDET